MQIDLLSELRFNRLLAVARLTIAGFFIAAMLIDPTPPHPHALQILCVYALVAAVALASTAFDAGRRPSKLLLPMFCVDCFVWALIMLVSAGSASPFASMSILVFFGASGRWGSKGVAWATVAVLLVMAATGLQIDGHIDVDWQRLIGRLGATLTTGGLIAAFGRHEERIRGEIQRLSSIEVGAAHTTEAAPALRAVEHALMVLGVTRAAMVWGDPEEPSLTVTRSFGGEAREALWTTADDKPHPVLEELQHPVLVDLKSGFSRMLDDEGRPSRASPELLRSPVLEAPGLDRLLVIPVKATDFMAWLMVEARDLRGEHLLVGAALAAQLSAMVESWRSLSAWRDAARLEARANIAADLHDGVVQFLAGADLHLQALDRETALDRPARDRVAMVRESLAQEQAELRQMIRSLKAETGRRDRDWIDFAQETQKLTGLLRRQWNVRFEVSLDGPFRRLPSRLAGELLQMVREASANAVRHGGARNLEIAGAEQGGYLVLTIRDDGCGMAEHGVFDQQTLTARDLGPRSVRARVLGVDGDLRVESSAYGVTLQIRAPIPGRAGASSPARAPRRSRATRRPAASA
jgi:signal transduction histidine kinase